MQQHATRFEELGVRLVVVTFEESGSAGAYLEETGLPWPILIDEQRTLYRAYGMGPGSRRRIFGPATWWAYLTELLRGRLPKPSRGDVWQLGGDVLIDPEGIVRLHHVSSGPADRPSVAALLRARGA